MQSFIATRSARGEQYFVELPMSAPCHKLSFLRSYHLIYLGQYAESSSQLFYWSKPQRETKSVSQKFYMFISYITCSFTNSLASAAGISRLCTDSPGGSAPKNVEQELPNLVVLHHIRIDGSCVPETLVATKLLLTYNSSVKFYLHSSP